VTFPESPVVCRSSNEAVGVRHAVTLGVSCEDKSSKYTFYGDLFFECSERSNNYEIIIDDFGIEGVRLACFETVTFPIGSTQGYSQVLPTVAVTTDEFWLAGSDGLCWDQVAVPQGPTAPTSSIPVVMPVTASPTITTSDPTVAPSDATTMKATNSPINAAPAVPFTTSAPITRSTKTSSGVVVGGVVGGIAAGIAIAVAIGLVVMRNKRSANAHLKADDNLRSSTTESGTDHDNFTAHRNAESSTSSMPTTSLIQPRANYIVSYKDQSRNVVDPSRMSRENIPMAVAVEAMPGGSPRAHPPGCRLED
jgi:hypothetical protein